MVAANFKMTSYFVVQLCLMSFVLNIFLVGYCAAESDEYYGRLKNVLQEWHAYIRTMVQFHVLGEMFDSLLHPGVPQSVPGTLVPNCMGSCHGQILIETATHS